MCCEYFDINILNIYFVNIFNINNYVILTIRITFLVYILKCADNKSIILKIYDICLKHM